MLFKAVFYKVSQSSLMSRAEASGKYLPYSCVEPPLPYLTLPCSYLTVPYLTLPDRAYPYL